jgi:hypothetical protein
MFNCSLKIALSFASTFPYPMTGFPFGSGGKGVLLCFANLKERKKKFKIKKKENFDENRNTFFEQLKIYLHHQNQCYGLHFQK